MLARNTQEPTYTVVIDGKAIGQVRRPTDLRVFGRARGTVYIARPIRKAQGSHPAANGRNVRLI